MARVLKLSMKGFGYANDPENKKGSLEVQKGNVRDQLYPDLICTWTSAIFLVQLTV
jgi:hypothetical protein